ncbi:hypothetical protein CRUP_026160 [Coryphaenoides rupestris]|nr:hypothetical protein CRUP_026160 [Coryphaenoides rupestris]
MRVLCEQKYCAVCREELDKVVFVKRLAAFSTLPYEQFHCEQRHDIYFSDANIHSQFRRLLLPECPYCPEPKVFPRFEELEQHIRKQHELFCCKLCTKHLKIFSHERKWYNRRELARHRTHGDPDDTSHRGHPLCKFCDDRYLDNDELLKHLRRDHYFCHFCDADGAQEYYCDYQYLSEHFRESHYLCEEGRCATEQFTHAFRSEIDYKAHKASAHSKNRAEARQNRQIDLQFNYAPRLQRRNDGMVTGEDYEETRQGRGGGRGGRSYGGQQKSWRYNRDEEERDVAAAMRASMMASRRPEERGQDHRGAPLLPAPERHRHEEWPEWADRTERVERTTAVRPERNERGTGDCMDRMDRMDRTERKERVDRTERVERKERAEADELRHRAGPIKNTPEPPPVRTMKSKNPFEEEDDFPVLGVPMPTVMPRALKADDFPNLSTGGPRGALKADDFPSLSAAASTVTTPMTPAYTAPPRNSSSFQAEDFPALVSRFSTQKPNAGSSTSAWASHAKPAPTSRANHHGPPPPSAFPAPGPPAFPTPGPQPLPSSSSTSASSSSVVTTSRRKKRGGEAQPAPALPLRSSSDEEEGGLTQREFRAVPTMLDISSLLTPPKPARRRKCSNNNNNNNKQPQPQPQQQPPQPQKNTRPPATPSKMAAPAKTKAMAAAQKENVPEQSKNNKPSPATTATVTATRASTPSELTNGFAEVALVPAAKKASSAAGLAHAPAVTPHPFPEPPPTEEEDFPALVTKKPPPGFKSTFPLKATAPPPGAPSSSSSTPPPPPPGLASAPSKAPPPGFTGIPLNSNVGVMSAAQYYRSCKELLGENFQRIFNELLVLLPDTSRQQELLAAHGDSRALDKQSGGGGGGAKKSKSKRNVWQTPTPDTDASSAILAELDCRMCPTCRQVLAPKDFNSHKTLHLGDSEDFPSLQSIRRIIR